MVPSFLLRCTLNTGNFKTSNMKEFIKELLRMSGWYFTPDSVAKKLKIGDKPKAKIIKMDAVYGNPPYRVSSN